MSIHEYFVHISIFQYIYLSSHVKIAQTKRDCELKILKDFVLNNSENNNLNISISVPTFPITHTTLLF